jgi:hypothetical protein
MEAQDDLFRQSLLHHSIRHYQIFSEDSEIIGEDSKIFEWILSAFHIDWVR